MQVGVLVVDTAITAAEARLVGRFLIRGYPFEENFFQPDAQAIRAK